MGLIHLPVVQPCTTSPVTFSRTDTMFMGVQISPSLQKAFQAVPHECADLVLAGGTCAWEGAEHGESLPVVLPVSLYTPIT